MNDRTVHQAIKGRAKTAPVESRARPKTIRGNIDLTPDELSLAIDMARSARIEHDICEYKDRKRSK